MSKKKILIVEDDPDMRLAFHIRLKANDYEVFHAADAVASIAAARTHRPDLILLDLGLPGGDGYLVMQRLKSNTLLCMIPVIVVSARDREANEGRALVAGAEAYLQKPVDNEVFLATIREVFEKGY
jgi:DNA-binding response OmpR family regulator